MKYRALGCKTIGLYAVFALMACTDNPLDTDVGASLTGNSPGAPPAMAARLDTVSRLIALGLGNPEVRMSALRAMRASEFPEHKLVLQDFIDTEGGQGLLTAGAAALGISSVRAVAIVASLPRLDFYVMRNEDRESWTGTPNVAVFGTLTSVEAPPTGFTPADERVRPNDARRLVTIALHPEEPKYRRLDLKPASDGAVIQDPGELQLGVAYTVKLEDGSLRTHVVQSMAELRQAGRVLDRLGGRNSNVALYGQPGQVVAPDVVTAYACDHGCAWGPENIELQFRSSINSQGEVWVSFDMPWVQFRTRQFNFPAIVLRNNVPAANEHLLWQLWEMDGTVFDNNDLWIDRDYLGSTFTNRVQTGGSPRCNTGDARFYCTPNIIWREINTFLAKVTSQGSVVNDDLEMNEAYGYVDVTVPPPPPFQVTITGTSEIPAAAGCTWFAQTTSGNGPFTYSWIINGQQVGTESSVWHWNDGSPFTLEVTVTDANGSITGDDHYVSINDNAACY